MSTRVLIYGTVLALGLADTARGNEPARSTAGAGLIAFAVCRKLAASRLSATHAGKVLVLQDGVE